MGIGPYERMGYCIRIYQNAVKETVFNREEKSHAPANYIRFCTPVEAIGRCISLKVDMS